MLTSVGLGLVKKKFFLEVKTPLEFSLNLYFLLFIDYLILETFKIILFPFKEIIMIIYLSILIYLKNL